MVIAPFRMFLMMPIHIPVFPSTILPARPKTVGMWWGGPAQARLNGRPSKRSDFQPTMASFTAIKILPAMENFSETSKPVPTAIVAIIAKRATTMTTSRDLAVR